MSAVVTAPAMAMMVTVLVGPSSVLYWASPEVAGKSVYGSRQKVSSSLPSCCAYLIVPSVTIILTTKTFFLQVYNDMIVLPISENMNSGKTHAFFAWAAEEAWVPPLTRDYDAAHATVYSYSNVTAPSSIPPAEHDPKSVRQEWQSSELQKPWVRPDFIVKVDDDSFVMLAELEARLRVELHTKPRFAHENVTANLMQPAGAYNRRSPVPTVVTAAPSPLEDPLVYWGYLVKNQFMAGELYALSWSVASWAARDPQVKGMVRGKEDKQVAKWMRIHPRAPEVRWKSERCWIYDHPKAGTVYVHNDLFS